MPKVRTRGFLDGEHEKRELLRVLLARLQLAVNDSAEHWRSDTAANHQPDLTMPTPTPENDNATDSRTDKAVVCDALVSLLPAHKCGLYIEHNAHLDVYQTVGERIEEWKDRESSGPDWESEEAKARAIATNELWTIQWYPNTPVGFNWIAAPTLAELLTFASKQG